MNKIKKLISRPALILCGILGLAMIMTGGLLLATSPGLRADTGTNRIHLDGDGTLSNPFMLTSRDDLNFLAQAINDERSPDQWMYLRNRHFRLANDIDLGGQTNPWLVPIGTTARPFSGTLDGRCMQKGEIFAIRNMFLNHTTANAPIVNYGLFGVATNATISNLRLENVSIVVAAASGASANIGSVVGNALVGTHFENVRAINGSITAPAALSVGGVVGRSSGTNATTSNRILASSSGLTVIGGTMVGGLAGETISTTMHQTFASGNVTASLPDARVGGLVGSIITQNSIDTTMQHHAVMDSFATGNVGATALTATGTFAVGGLVGQIQTATTHIRNTYFSGNILVDTTSGTVNVGGLVGLTTGTTAITQSAVIGGAPTAIINVPANTARVVARLAPGAHGATVANNNHNLVNSALTNQLTLGDQFPGTQYPTDAEGTHNNRHVARATFLQRQTWVDINWNMGWIWDISSSINNGLPHLRVFGEGDDDSSFSGRGTAASPWILSSENDLTMFRDLVNSGFSFAGRHFAMGPSTANPGGNIVLTANNWVPIGITSALGFAGHFDGRGHTIGGLRITSATAAAVGLFGHVLTGATISNLVLDQPHIRIEAEHADVGALAGMVNTHVFIHNITARNVNVAGTLRVGGLIGQGVGSGLQTNALHITNVHVTGTVSGREEVGGIGGRLNSTHINLTSFVGNVRREILTTTTTGTNFGGLVGMTHSITISNSFVRGSVRDIDEDVINNNHNTSVHVGGLVGWTGSGHTLTINNSYFEGPVIEGRARSGSWIHVGGLVGAMQGSGALNINNSWAAPQQMIAHTTSTALISFGWLVTNGTTGTIRASSRLETTQLVGRNTSTGEVFTTTITVDDEPVTTPFNFTANNRGEPTPQPITRFQTPSFYTMGIALGGIAWDLTSVWHINQFLNDGFPFHRAILPPVGETQNPEFRGNGTAGSPFIIRTAGEFRLMRDLVNTGMTFENHHFRMEADIDLGGAPWMPIGRVNGVSFFSGHFDGGGHTIRGLFISEATANRGLFGITRNASFRNLTIENPQFAQVAGGQIGALIGRAMGSTTIDNVHVNGGLVQGTGSDIGGIVGFIDSTTFPAILTNSSSSSTVWSTTTAGGWGGLVGRATATIPHGITISHSFFEGFVRRNTGAMSGSNDNAMGGILGVGQGVNINQVYNAGEVFSAGGLMGVGGIVGMIHSANASSIRNSYNIGSVATIPVANSWHGSIGGIVGIIHSGPNVVIENVFNSGTLRTLSNATSHVGGIVGFAATASTRVSINGAVSIGDIHTWQTITSRAWFANAYAFPTIDPATSQNNLFRDDLEMIVNTEFADQTRMLHMGAGTAPRSVEQLRNWNTYSAIGWNNTVWAIDPAVNNGLPHLRGMLPTANQTQEARTLVIRTLDEFLAFRDRVNGTGPGATTPMGDSFPDRHIRVETDLNLQHIPNWVPIGINETNPFSGRIDFAGHTVSGLRLGTSRGDFGLFGWVNNGARIENLILESPNVNGVSHTNIGSVVGRINNSATLENVHVTGDGLVRGSTTTGGMVGFIENAINVRMNNTSSTARVTGAAVSAGGLIGRAEFVNVAARPRFTGINISNSFASGSVVSTSTSVGGFIGWTNGGVNIERSYAAGNVQGTTHIGGFVGDVGGVNNFITDAFALGSVRGNAADLGGFVGRINGMIHYRQVYARGIVDSTTTTAGQRIGGLFGALHVAPAINFRIEGGAAINPSVSAPGVHAIIGRFGTGQTAANTPGLALYPQGSRLDNMVMGRINNASPIHDETTFSVVNGVRVLSLAQFQQWGTWQSKGYNSDIWEINPNVNEGLPTLRGLRFEPEDFPGSPASPTVISTYEQLVDFRSRVNEGNNFFGQTVVLANDIDMAGRPAWLQIGTATNFFAGTFDGRGHFIRNMHASNPTASFGFFGHTRGATIRNLGFIDTNVTTDAVTAGIVVGTSLAQLTLENVFAVNGQLVSRNNNVGGLVGIASGTQNMIRRSYIDNVTIQGNSIVGGLVGTTQSITVEHSYFDGVVRGFTTAGHTSAGAVIRVGGIIGDVTELSATSTIIRNVSVSGMILANGILMPGGQFVPPTANPSTDVFAGGVIGMDASVLTTIITNTLINATIFSAGTTGHAMASGFVGHINQAQGLHITNSVIVGGAIQVHGAVPIQRPVFFGTSTMGIGIFTYNNRINPSLIDMRNDPLTNRPFSHLGTTTMEDQLLLGGDTDFATTDPAYFRARSTYEELGWNLSNTWIHDPAVNNSLPYLRGMTAVVELLMAVIEYAESFRGVDFSNATFQALQTEIMWARGFVAAGGTIEREELFNVITRVRNAIANLRADDTELRALVEFVEVNLVHASSQFVTFAQVEALMRDANVMLARTQAGPDGDNRVINSVVRQMTNALRTAIDNLQIDRTILQNLILDSMILQEHHFTPASWALFQLALDAAIVVNNQSNPTIDSVLGAYSLLYARVASLDYYYGRLEILVDQADAYGWTPPAGAAAAWPNFLAVRGMAGAILEEAKAGRASLQEILDAEADLVAALASLHSHTFDAPTLALRNEIQSLITQARGLIATQYDPPGWAVLQTAVTNAQNALTNPGTAFAQLESVRDALVSAFAGLTTNVQPLRQALNAAENRLRAALVPADGRTIENANTADFFYGDAGAINALRNLFVEIRNALDMPHLGPTIPGTDVADAIVARMNTFINRLTNAQDNLVLNFTPLITRMNFLRAQLDPNQRPFFTAESFDALQLQVDETQARLDAGISRADLLAAEYTLLDIAWRNLSMNMDSLQYQVDRALLIRENFVTVATWTPFATRLEEAQNLLRDGTMDINDVINATNALTTAFNNLRPDGTHVTQAVNDMTGGIFVAANFRGDSWAVFEAARTAASTAATAAASATTNTVLTLQTRYDELQNAYRALTPNMVPLETAIQNAQFIDTALFNTASVAALNNAITNGQTVVADMASTIQQVLYAIDWINLAITELVINTDALQLLLNQVDALSTNSHHFVVARWNALVTEAGLAQAFIDSEPREAQRATLATRITALQTALDNLEIETGALAELIEQANDILDMESRFTRESIRLLRIALEGALTAAESGTFDEISAATIILANAIANTVSIHELILVRMVGEVFTREDVIDDARWLQLQSLINSVEPLLEAGTSVQVFTLTTNLRNAILGLIVREDYTVQSFNTYLNRLEEAFTGISLLPTVPNTVIVRIALDALVSIVELRDLLEFIEELYENRHVFANWSVVQDVLDLMELDEAGNRFFEILSYGTRADIAAYIIELEEAVAALRYETSALNILITQLRQRQAINYTDNSFAILTSALERAEALRDNVAGQTYRAIQEAIEELTAIRDEGILVNIQNLEGVSLKTAVEFFRPTLEAGQGAGGPGLGQNGANLGFTLSSWTTFVNAFNAAVEATRSASMNLEAMMAWQALLVAFDPGLTLNPAPELIDPALLAELQALYDQWSGYTAADFTSGFGALSFALGNASYVLGIPTDNEGNITINNGDIQAVISQLQTAIGNVVWRWATPPPGWTPNPPTDIIPPPPTDWEVGDEWPYNPDIIPPPTGWQPGDPWPNPDGTIPEPPRKDLNPVGNIVFDSSHPNLRVQWFSVDNANGYWVIINGGTPIERRVTWIDLRGLGLGVGTHTITIIAFTDCDEFYDSPPASIEVEILVGEGQLNEVGQITFDQSNMLIVWNAVADAEGYLVLINGQTHEVTENQIYIGGLGLPYGTHHITIVAISSSLLWHDSNPVVRSFTIYDPNALPNPHGNLAQAGPVTLDQSSMIVAWTSVPNATGYRVTIEGVTRTVLFSQINISTLGLGYGTHNITIVAFSSDPLWLDSAPITHSFTIVDLTDPNIPDPVGQLNQVGTITFYQPNMIITWVEILNADGYRVTINGITRLVLTNSIDVLEFGLTNLSIGTHNVTIVTMSNNPQWDDSNPVQRQFTIVDTSTPPPPIGQLVQVGAIVFDQDTMIIAWSPVMNAEGYRVVIDGVTRIVPTSQINVTDLALGIGTHNMTIVAFTSDPLWTDSDPVTRTFEIEDRTVVIPPTGQLESVGAINFDRDAMMLRWSAVENATAYRVFINGILHFAMSNEFDLIGLSLSYGTHTVSIVAFSSDPDWEDSDPSNRTIYLPDPGEPPVTPLVRLASVMEIIFDAENMMLMWEEVINADGYRITINSDIHLSLTDRLYLGDLNLPYGTHTITIVAFSVGEWEDSEPTTREITLVATGTPPDPSAQQLTQVGTPIFSQTAMLLTWVEVPNAEGYRVTINGETITVLTNSVDVIRFGLTAGSFGTHQVIFVAFSSDILWLDSAPATREFEIVDPGTVITQEPLDRVSGITFNQDTMRMTWNAVDNADGYTVTIGSITRTVFVNQIDILAEFGNLAYGEYTAIIIAFSGNIAWLDSPLAEHAFRINPPGTVEQPLAQVGTPVFTQATMTLTWATVPNADGYRVTINSATHTVRTNSVDVLTFGIIATNFGVHQVTFIAFSDAPEWLDSPVAVREFEIVDPGTVVQNPLLPVTGIDFDQDTMRLTWNVVTNANGYNVTIGSVTRTVFTNEIDLTVEFPGLAYGPHTASIVAFSTDIAWLPSSPVNYPFVINEPPVTAQPLAQVGIPIFVQTAMTLSWENVPNADGYRVTISGVTVTVRTNSIDVLRFPITDTMFGIHQVTFVAFSDLPQWDDSPPVQRQFEIIDPGTVTQNPLAQVTGITFIPATMRLTWNTVTNANSYTVTIGSETRTVFTNEIDLVAEFGALAVGQHTATIVAFSTDVAWLPSSPASHAFNVPDTGPGPGALDTPQNLTLNNRVITWNAVSGAQRYEIWVDGPNGRTLLNTVTDTTYTLPVWTVVGDYVITIRAVADGRESSGFSNSVTFRVLRTLDAPQNLRVTGTTLEWNAVDGANQYAIYVDGTRRQTVSVLMFDLSTILTEIGDFRIQVRALGNDVIASELSGDVTFRVHGPLDAPVLNINNNVLSWNAVDAAERYEIWVDGVLHANNITVLTYTLDMAVFGVEREYRITIRAVADGRPNSPFSNEVTFKGDGSIEAQQLTPPTNLTRDGETLTWTAVTGATRYHIFVNGAYLTTVTGTTFDLSVISAVGEHTITIRAGALDKHESDASEPLTFTRLENGNIQDPSTGGNFLMDNLPFILAGVGALILVSALVLLLRKRGKNANVLVNLATVKENARNAINSAFGELQKAGEYVMAADANPADAVAQERAMAQLSATDEAMTKAEQEMTKYTEAKAVKKTKDKY